MHLVCMLLHSTLLFVSAFALRLRGDVGIALRTGGSSGTIVARRRKRQLSTILRVIIGPFLRLRITCHLTLTLGLTLVLVLCHEAKTLYFPNGHYEGPIDFFDQSFYT